MNNLTLSGNNNNIQIMKSISNLILNGTKNKIFISAKIINIIVNGNSNIINVVNVKIRLKTEMDLYQI